MESATEFTHGAQIQVKQAVSYKKQAQRKKCVITLIVIIAILVLSLIFIIMLSALLPHFASQH